MREPGSCIGERYLGDKLLGVVLRQRRTAAHARQDGHHLVDRQLARAILVEDVEGVLESGDALVVLGHLHGPARIR